MPAKNYSDLSQEELIRLLEARDRRDATRFGLVWEANEVERDRALNRDFVALDLDPALSAGGANGADGGAAWRNLIIEGDNFDALRYLRMTFAGRVKCIYIDPPGTPPSAPRTSWRSSLRCGAASFLACLAGNCRLLRRGEVC